MQGMLVKSVGTHIISLSPLNNTTEGVMLFAFYNRKLSLKNKRDRATSFLLSLSPDSPRSCFSLPGKFSLSLQLLLILQVFC